MFLIVDAQRRQPQLRDLGMLLLALEASYPDDMFLEVRFCKGSVASPVTRLSNFHRKTAGFFPAS